MQDIELINECRKDPEKGLVYIIDQYIALVHTIINGKISTVGSSEDIKECVSEVFMDLFNQIDNINLEKGSIKAYLAVIANRKAIDLYRRLIKIASHSTYIDIELADCEDIAMNIERNIIDKEEREMLLKAIDSLGEPDNEIFFRKYYLGQKTKEIAYELNLRDNTVDKKISRGLKKLRLLLGGAQFGEENGLLAK